MFCSIEDALLNPACVVPRHALWRLPAAATICCTMAFVGSLGGQGVPAAPCALIWQKLPAASKASAPALLFDYPDAARWRDRLVVVGDPALAWNTSGAAATQTTLIGAAVWKADGTVSVITPWSSRIPMYPRLASTRDGRLHVIYGTKVDMRGRQWTTAPDTLWHVEYDGTKWSAPEPLPSTLSGPYWWDNISPSALVATGQRLDIAIPVKSRDTTTIVVLQRDGAGHWSMHALATGNPLVAYVRLARLGDVLVLEWAGPDPTMPSDRASIFVSRSTNGGRTWDAPQRLFLAAGHGTSYDHTLLLDSLGRGYLFWAQQPPRPGRTDSIGEATTTDTGRTWRRLDALSVPDGFGLGTLRAALTPSGALVVYGGPDGVGVRVALRNGGWVSPRINDPIPFGGQIPLVRWPGTALTVVGSEMTSLRIANDSNPTARPVTRLFSIVLTCGS